MVKDEYGMGGYETSTWHINGNVTTDKGIGYNFEQVVVTTTDYDSMGNEEFMLRLMNTFPVGIAVSKKNSNTGYVYFLPWQYISRVEITNITKA